MKITDLWDMALCSFVKLNDVLEVHTAPIIGGILPDNGRSCSPETSVYFTRLHSAISQKAVIFRMYEYVNLSWPLVA
jgi:hypothetical protein